MNAEIQKKLTLFVENAQSVKKGFVWQNASVRRLAALFYTQEDKTVNCEAIRRCHALIKENTGLFSMFRGNMALCVAALLSLADNPKNLFENTVNVYDRLKKAKFRSSDYLAVAAYQIAAGTEQYDRAVTRARMFYDGMKAYHRFYTGQDDYIYAAMLGMSDLDTNTGIACIEQLHSRLKGSFWDKNSVQALAQILVLGGSTDEVTDRVLALRDVLKAQKLRFDKTYTLPSLGVLALLPTDINVMAQDVSEVREMLRTQKGFGSFFVDTQELLLYAAGIVGTVYLNGVKDGVLSAALSTSIANIIIAQQVAMMAAISATSAAAAASSN